MELLNTPYVSTFLSIVMGAYLTGYKLELFTQIEKEVKQNKMFQFVIVAILYVFYTYNLLLSVLLALCLQKMLM